MTFSSPHTDFYDDGLVHSHDWSRSTPPGSHHRDPRTARNSAPTTRRGAEHDESITRDERRAHA